MGRKGKGKAICVYYLFIPPSPYLLSKKTKKTEGVKFQVLRAQTVDETLDRYTTISIRIIDGVV